MELPQVSKSLLYVGFYHFSVVISFPNFIGLEKNIEREFILRIIS